MTRGRPHRNSMKGGVEGKVVEVEKRKQRRKK